MASGDTLAVFVPQDNEAPVSAYATLDARNGHPVLDFDAASDEIAQFTAVLPRNYAGGGITAILHTTATSATSGTARWQTAFEKISGQDIDSDGFATANSAAAVANATSGIETVTPIAHTDGAQIDAIVGGDAFRLRVTRDADGTTGTDDMAGDAELLAVELKET